MNRKEWGELVRCMRVELSDPVSGGAMTQQKLADLCQLPLKTIGAIERGQKRTLDEVTLTSLAKNLRLSLPERQQFFSSSCVVDQKAWRISKEERAVHLAQMIESARITHVPATVHDQYRNLLYANPAWLAFHQLTDQHFYDGIGSSNFLRLLFADAPLRRLFGATWAKVVERELFLWRGLTFQYRHTAYFERLMARLIKESGFRLSWNEIRWQDGDKRDLSRVFTFPHPIYGEVAYQVSNSQLLFEGGAFFVALLTPNSAQTDEIFRQLVQDSRVAERSWQALDLDDEALWTIAEQ